MFTIIALMLSGMLGYLLRNKNLKKVHILITTLIWLLLFLLGVEVGGNEQIVGSLHTLGLEALLLSAGGIAGSVIAAWALWRMLYPRQQKGGAL